jgi:GNAT superfamily N-acetyltransferase
MLEIRSMRPADVTFAKSLTDYEAWGHERCDFERLLELDPLGCFVAWENDERVGIATTIRYNDYAFLGNIIVKQNKRGGIIGPYLMEHAVRYLVKSGAGTIELDGVLPAVAMYRHMGFEEKYRSLRLIRKPAGRHRGPPASKTCSESTQIVAEFDHNQTGIRRQHLIRKLVEEFPDRVFCLKVNGLKAYALARERATGVVSFGPVVAENLAAYSSLLSNMLTVFDDRTVTIGVPEVNNAGVEFLLRNGFVYRAHSMRMYRGARIEYERHIYGIVAADVG